MTKTTDILFATDLLKIAKLALADPEALESNAALEGIEALIDKAISVFRPHFQTAEVGRELRAYLGHAGEALTEAAGHTAAAAWKTPMPGKTLRGPKPDGHAKQAIAYIDNALGYLVFAAETAVDGG